MYHPGEGEGTTTGMRRVSMMLKCITLGRERELRRIFVSADEVSKCITLGRERELRLVAVTRRCDIKCITLGRERELRPTRP